MSISWYGLLVHQVTLSNEIIKTTLSSLNIIGSPVNHKNKYNYLHSYKNYICDTRLSQHSLYLSSPAKEIPRCTRFTHRHLLPTFKYFSVRTESQNSFSSKGKEIYIFCVIPHIGHSNPTCPSCPQAWQCS